MGWTLEECGRSVGWESETRVEWAMSMQGGLDEHGIDVSKSQVV